jgi:hypothetical protein
MDGIIRAVARLLVMGIVMLGVLIASVFAGIATTTAVSLGVVLAGLVGMVGYVRSARGSRSAANQIAAIMSPASAQPANEPAFTFSRTAVDAMAPQGETEVDPEAGIPRWRRKSLIEARRADPFQSAPTYRLPMRFSDSNSGELDLRTVRYAVVPVLDRPDEVLGLRLSDLGSGDEVQVLRASGAFVEVLCPNGDQGWVHRTTLSQRTTDAAASGARQPMPQDADDALTALLSARGLI